MEAPKMLEITKAKDSIFYPKHSLNLRGDLHFIDRPWIMGILNITPDSFYDGGSYPDQNALLEKVKKMQEDGADIIDVGAQSTRPGASFVSSKEEISRLKPVLKILKEHFYNLKISVDTYQSEVARAAVDLGAHIINDISGGTMDDHMFNTMAELQVPYVLMHIKGKPETMQNDPQYKDVVKELMFFLSRQIEKLEEKGVNDIIVDPGFGFGKSLDHNYQLLNELEAFHILNKPMLVGFSRKSMINKVLGTLPSEALNGTTVLNTMALQKGATILRVHDVKEAKEASKIVTFTQNLA